MTKEVVLFQGPPYQTEQGRLTRALGNLSEGVDPLGIRVVSALLKEYAKTRGIPIHVTLYSLGAGVVRHMEDIIAHADMVLGSARFVDTPLMKMVIANANKLGKPVAVGGYGPSYQPDYYQGAKVIVKGEVKPVADELFNILFSTQVQEDVILDTQPLPPNDIFHHYVWPDRTLPTNPWNERFQWLTGRRRVTMTWIEACQNACTYCITTKMQQGGSKEKVRYRNHDDVIREIESMGLTRGDIIFLTDNDTFLIPRDELLPILQYIKEKGIYFLTEGTLSPLIEDFNQYGEDKSLLRYLSPADGSGGCLTIAYGVDDLAVEKVKGSRNKEKDAFIKGYPLLQRYQIPMFIMIIVGLEGHGYPDIFYEAVNFFHAYPASAHCIHIATPERGTVFGDQFWENGLITDFNPAHANHQHVIFPPGRMTTEQLQQGYYWLQRQLYHPGGLVRKLWNMEIKDIRNRGFFPVSMEVGLMSYLWKMVTQKEIAWSHALDPQFQKELDDGFKKYLSSA